MDTPKTSQNKMKIFRLALEGEEEQNIREITQIMKKLLASLHFGKNNEHENYFSLELAVNNTDDQVHFYIAIPEDKEVELKEQINRLFPQAKLHQLHRDYSIFEANGKNLGSYAVPGVNDLLELNTYYQLDRGPLLDVIKVLFELKDIGEGVALQLICAPIGSTYMETYGQKLDYLKINENINKKIQESGILNNQNNTKDNIDDKKINFKVSENLVSKANSTILQTNLRLLVSTDDQIKSQHILQRLENSFSVLDNPRGNQIKFERVVGNKLDNMIRNFSGRIFDNKQAFFMNLREIATLFHFSNIKNR